VYAQRAIVIDALAVLRECGLAEGTSGPPNGVEARDEQAQAEAVGQAIAAMNQDMWEGLSHQQRQVLLVAQATVRHYRGRPSFDTPLANSHRLPLEFLGESRRRIRRTASGGVRVIIDSSHR
jgi:hypothetical protein